MSASTGVAPARRIAAHRSEKTEWRGHDGIPAPIPAPASASHSASVPEEQPSACFTPSCSAAARSNAATCSPRINCCVSSTCPSASQQLRWSGTYWRFRSSIGTGVRGCRGVGRTEQAGMLIFLHTSMLSASRIGTPQHEIAETPADLSPLNAFGSLALSSTLSWRQNMARPRIRLSGVPVRYPVQSSCTRPRS